MSDKPIGLTSQESAQWVAPLPNDDPRKPVAKETPLCLGCGRYHGGVVEAQRCLEWFVRALAERYPSVLTELRTLRSGSSG